MRFKELLLIVFVGTFSFAAQDVKRLSPVPMASQIPSDCVVASVLKDSPASKAGIVVGDILESVNNVHPRDASVFPETLVSAPEVSEFDIQKSSGALEHVQIHLNANRPRLGAVCDLSGWAKPGLTAAGNESMTVFKGPYALTISGIIDKGFVFIRTRLDNDSDQSLDVSPSLYQATDGNGNPMPLLSPKDIACLMHGDKGAHLLALKKNHKDTLDAHVSALSGTGVSDEQCSEQPKKGSVHKSDSEYAEANAKYLAEESLWPITLQPGQIADGLIYFKEPASLPISVQVEVSSRILSGQLGLPVADGKQMKIAELRQFFEGQKKGSSIRLTLKKGKVFVGKFSSYDTVNERAWFDTPTSGMLKTTSYSLETIRSAEPLDQIPAKPAPNSDHLN